MGLAEDYAANGVKYLNDYQASVDGKLAQAALDLAFANDSLRLEREAHTQTRAQLAEKLINIALLEEEIRDLELRIAELENEAPPSTGKSGALPLGTTDYPVPVGNGTAIVNTVAAITAAINTGSATNVTVRGGVYNIGNLRPSRQVVIQAYPGEVVWFEGGSTFQWAFIFKGAVTLRGIGLRGYKVLDSNVWERGFLIPDGANGSVVENCVFEDFGDTALQVFSNSNVKIVNNTFRRSGTNHIGSDRVTNLLVDRNLMIDANRQGREMQPTTSAFKDTRSKGTVASNNVIIGAPKVGGIWLDWSCTDFKIVNNDITDTGYEQIQAEACERGIIAGNYCRGIGNVSSYNIRSYDSGNVKIFNNDVLGGKNYNILVSQDERRNTNAAEIADGVTWIARNNVVSNNVFGNTWQHYQFGTEGQRTAEEMITSIEGNTMPLPAAGVTGGPVAWNTTSGRVNETVAQMNTKHPAIAKGNGPTPTLAAIPADVASAMGVPANSKIAGIGRNRLTYNT